MKVLIVDDSTPMRMRIKRMLKGAGFTDFTVVEAKNGLEGLQKIEEEKPDLIFSDWNMPNMDGPTFAAALKEKGVETPFGFITTEASIEIIKQAKILGAAFHIAKPFSEEKFKTSLGKYFAS